jgi:dynamin 1-like protein
MDSGTNALDILQGRGGYPLKLGFIGIVNRSQRDIDENKLMSDAMADEQRFFETHPVYKTIAYKSGTKYLAKTLNSVRFSPPKKNLAATPY